ncbi:MAG TPA: ABC transporter substrate-binding protein [Xanthobacteraceae bacterium]|nr:ABC transporter substrate-binding protein [Xanthobacteraceae bacterium]
MRAVRTISLLAALLMIALAAMPARANETLRVGKAVPEAFSFLPLDVGMREGLFKQNGLEIDEIAFAGDAKLQQAMAADSLDIALGSGPAMGFIAKGSPVKAIAAMAGPPLDLVIVVRPDGPTTAAELKGKKVSVSTVGGLTYWLVSETSRQQGWGPDGIDISPMGAMAPQIAALQRGDIDGVVTDISTALDLERTGKARVLMRFGQIVKDFHVHVIYATDKLIASRPDAIRAFLKGWFEAIAFMRHHKPDTVAIATQVIGKDDDINGKTYDELMPMFSDDGRFNPKALQTLAQSFVELKVLPAEPDMSKLYTEAFLPMQAPAQ